MILSRRVYTLELVLEAPNLVTLDEVAGRIEAGVLAVVQGNAAERGLRVAGGGKVRVLRADLKRKR